MANEIRLSYTAADINERLGKVSQLAQDVEDLKNGVVGGAQSDWNQNDETAVDYVKNRPFYTEDLVETELIDVNAFLEENEVNWELVIEETIDGTNYLFGAYLPPTIILEEGKTYSILINDNKYTATATLESVDGMSVIFFGDFDAYFEGDDNDFTYLVGLIPGQVIIIECKLPEAPTVCKIYEYEQEIVKLDPKYLPEGGVGYTEVVGETTTTETYDILQLMTEAGVEFDENTDEATGETALVATLTEEQMPINIVEGMEYTTVINGVSYTSNAVDVSATVGYPLVGFGDMEALAEDLTNFRYAIAREAFPGQEAVYLIVIVPSALDLTEAPTEFVVTSNVINTIETIHQINPKYLPEHVQPDWNENDSESKGYIANRPFYDSSILVEWDGTGESISAMAPLFKVSDTVVTDNELIKNGIVTLSDGTVIPLSEEYDDAIVTDKYVLFGDAPFVFIKKAPCTISIFTFPEAGIYSFKDDGSAYLVKFETQGEIIKIDPKYLPDQLSTPDWNENDETSSSYIKNRPFYEYKDYVYAPGDILLEEQTVVIDNEYATISSELIFVADKKYVVVLNGEQYTCVAWDNGNGAIVIGNGNIYGGEGMGENVPFSCDSYDDGNCYLNVTEPGEYTITISELETEKEVVVVKKLDPKYLPTTTELILKDIKTGYDYTIQIYDGNLITYRKFEKVEVTTPPNRIYYLPGDIFDPTGMVITGTYSDGTSAIVASYSYPDAITEDNIVNFPIYCIDGGVTVNISLLLSSLADFDYIYSEDNSITLTDWKETYNGVPSTELIIPEEVENFTIIL